jgi:hypothetical protein
MNTVRTRPGAMVDTNPAMAGVGDDVGAAVVAPIVVPGVVVEECGGYHRPSGLHRHCPRTAAEGRRWPSSRSSAVRDRAAVVGRLEFWLG